MGPLPRPHIALRGHRQEDTYVQFFWNGDSFAPGSPRDDVRIGVCLKSGSPENNTTDNQYHLPRREARAMRKLRNQEDTQFHPFRMRVPLPAVPLASQQPQRPDAQKCSNMQAHRTPAQAEAEGSTQAKRPE